MRASQGQGAGAAARLYAAWLALSQGSALAAPSPAEAAVGEGPPPVVLGNPPYSNYGRLNQGRWISGLMADWRPAGERKWNPDDFMKFLRWAQWLVERRGAGVVALVTPNTYLDGITHRRMRQSLAASFGDIWLLDLHGNARKQETCPDGSPDENVFGIQQGVAIGLFVRGPGEQAAGRVWHAELCGSRESKLTRLAATDVASTEWTELRPAADRFFFVPRTSSDAARREYDRGWRLTEIF